MTNVIAAILAALFMAVVGFFVWAILEGPLREWFLYYGIPIMLAAAVVAIFIVLFSTIREQLRNTGI